jgi:hypothetical protein
VTITSRKSLGCGYKFSWMKRGLMCSQDHFVELDFVEWMTVLAEARPMVAVQGAVSLRLKI